jgi:nicotinamide-nucleotide amidase
MFPPPLLERAAALLDDYRARGWRLAAAESCTGGLVAGLLTEIAGSSDVVERGFVTYSNEAKTGLLGVPGDLIVAHGAVSELVARAMADGALARSNARVAVAITGVAGPGGGSERKPVGLVHFGLAAEDRPTEHLERRYGDLGRSAIRLAAVEDALGLLEEALRRAGSHAPHPEVRSPKG